MARLTDKQRAFCRHLITGMTGAEAARAAGYKNGGRQAYQLLEKPHITEYLRDLRAQIDHEGIMTAEEVLRRLSGIARGEGEADKATSRGVFTTGPEWSDQTRALDLLAKHHGVLKERIELTTQKRPEDMTDEELEEVLARASRNA